MMEAWRHFCRSGDAPLTRKCGLEADGVGAIKASTFVTCFNEDRADSQKK